MDIEKETEYRYTKDFIIPIKIKKTIDWENDEYQPFSFLLIFLLFFKHFSIINIGVNMKKINDCILTEYIYIPFYDNVKLNYKENDYVYMNDILYEKDGQKQYSSVSGNLLGTTKINNATYLVIKKWL